MGNVSLKETKGWKNCFRVYYGAARNPAQDLCRSSGSLWRRFGSWQPPDAGTWRECSQCPERSGASRPAPSEAPSCGPWSDSASDVRGHGPAEPSLVPVSINDESKFKGEIQPRFNFKQNRASIFRPESENFM